MKEWQDQGLLRVTMAVNFSARQFRQADLLPKILETLQSTRLDPEYLDVEITEGVAMEDVSASSGTLKALKEHGINSSIDDFGTGYSSLNYLQQFPVNKLKIDRAFITHITDDSRIAKAVIGLAKSMDLKVLAEGVENSAQNDTLQTLGCDLVQGYYFSQPLWPDEMQKILHQGAIQPSDFVLV